MNLASLSRSAVTKTSSSDKFVTLSSEALKSVVGGAGVYLESLPDQALSAMYRTSLVGYEMSLDRSYAVGLYQESFATATRQY